ncbi:MAG: MATE family efflux transporter [Halioglobus sp.]|nr:MATE family efflux transporter [Halioglobus sp.]
MPSANHTQTLRQLLALAIPIAIGGAVQTSYHLINAFWVGRLGADAVAVVSVCFPVNLLLISLGSGLSLAGTILVAQYFGARDTLQVNHTIAQCLVAMILAALLLGAVGYVAAPGILRTIGARDAVFDSAIEYLRISLAGTVFLFLSAFYQAILRGIGEAKAPLRIIIASVGVNALLDPVLIFGWGPIGPMGVNGAAYATLLTQLITAVAGIYLMLRPRFGLRLTWPDLYPRWPMIGKLVKLGFPASLEQSMQALTVMAMTMLAARFDTVVLASYGLVFRILMFTIIPAFSFSMATSILVGQHIGAGEGGRARQTTVVSAIGSSSLMLCIAVLLFSFATPIMALFVPGNPQLIEQGTLVLRIFTLSYPLTGLQLSLAGTFRGAGDTFTAMLLTLVGIWVVQLPAAYLLSRFSPLGSDGLWWAGVIAACVSTAMAILYFRSGRWMRVGERLTAAGNDR